MKPFIHARNSARKYGGKPEDYQAIHDFFDSSKQTVADMRHRAILHSAFGIFIAERVFGTTVTNSDGRQISVRDICEDHVIEDLGFIPSVEKWLKHLPMEDWMFGSDRGRKTKSDRFIPFDETTDNLVD